MKKSLNVLLLVAFAMSLTVWSCKPKQVINEAAEEAAETIEQAVEEEGVEMVEEEICAYDRIEGKGVITKLNLSNTNEVVIKFRFEPNDKDVSRFPEVSNEDVIFNVDGIGNYPPLSWCKENGIEKGASFDCVRYELAEKESDECEKVSFSFTEFEDKGW